MFKAISKVLGMSMIVFGTLKIVGVMTNSLPIWLQGALQITVGILLISDYP